MFEFAKNLVNQCHHAETMSSGNVSRRTMTKRPTVGTVEITYLLVHTHVK